MTLTENLYEFLLRWNKHVLHFFSRKPEIERNKFSHFKIFRWFRELSFSLDLFSLQIRVSEKDRENLHFFYTDRQNWNTLTRFLWQVIFIANWEKKRVPRKRQFSKSGTFYPNFFNYFFKFFSATFVTFWIGIIF
jgi:hypothetical protein